MNPSALQTMQSELKRVNTLKASYEQDSGYIASKDREAYLLLVKEAELIRGAIEWWQKEMVHV